MGTSSDKTENKPQVYKDVVELLKHIKAVQDSAQATSFTISVIADNAATRITDELMAAIGDWDARNEERAGNPDIYMNNKLSTACRAAVNNNRGMLMADPAFWEQVKESVNNFTQKYGGFDFFTVRKTIFGYREGMKESVAKLVDDNAPTPQPK